MPDAIDFQLDRLGDIVADQFEPRMIQPVGNIRFAACEVIVQADDLFSRLHQSITKMRAEETSAAGNQIASERTGHQKRIKQRCERFKSSYALALVGLPCVVADGSGAQL